MAKYQKKVVQIEAYQLGAKDAPEWFNEAVANGLIFTPLMCNYVELVTPKNNIRGYRGDYVILSPDGTLYLCKKSLFDATYEPYVDFSDFGEEMVCDPIPEISEKKEGVVVNEV